MNKYIIERVVYGFAFGLGILIVYNYIIQVYNIGFLNGDFYARKKRLSKSVILKFPNGKECREISETSMGDSIQRETQSIETKAEDLDNVN